MKIHFSRLFAALFMLALAATPPVAAQTQFPEIPKLDDEAEAK